MNPNITLSFPLIDGDERGCRFKTHGELAAAAISTALRARYPSDEALRALWHTGNACRTSAERSNDDLWKPIYAKRVERREPLIGGAVDAEALGTFLADDLAQRIVLFTWRTQRGVMRALKRRMQQHEGVIGECMNGLMEPW